MTEEGAATGVGGLLRRLVQQLDEANIPHMVAGSFASTFHGVPRSTQHIDIVIDPGPAALESFVTSLSTDDYYVDTDAARDALRRRSQFNVIDMESGWKADLIIRKSRPFSVEELGRRQPAELFGVALFVATAEDSIIAKLEWAKLGDSERQLRDVVGMVSVRGAALDLAYVDRWVSELGLVAEWERVRPR